MNKKQKILAICNKYITFAPMEDDNKVIRKVILSDEFSNRKSKNNFN